jgi:NhaP-type Na+/H+ or K+/H+ antiporter
VLLGFVSLSYGLIFGLLTSFFFKHCSFLHVSAITETFLMIGFSYMSYFMADFTTIAGIKMSGIISLLTCGIVQSHYLYYNLSPQGKIISTSTVAFISHAAEAGVYSYIGLSLYSNLPGWWSFDFIIAQTVIVIVGRYSAIFICFFLFNRCFKSRTINPKELFFIGWGGMIRGAVAFALVMRIPYEGHHSCINDGVDDCFTKQNYEMIVTTTLVLVIFTTVFFGTFMSMLGRIIVPPKKEDMEEHEMDMDSSVTEQSHHHLIQHPNEVTDLSESKISIGAFAGDYFTWRHSRFVKWFAKFDEETLQPIFIRNSDKKKQEDKEDNDDTFLNMKDLNKPSFYTFRNSHSGDSK